MPRNIYVQVKRQKLTDKTVEVEDLRRSPLGVLTQAQGEPVAMLMRGEPAMYCVPAQTYEQIIGRIHDLEAQLAERFQSAVNDELVES